MAAAARQYAPSPATRSREENELLEIIRVRSFRSGDFVLSSGAHSSLYFNLKPTMMSPRGARLSAQAFLSRALAEDVEYVGGLEMGAVPIISGLATISDIAGRPVATFFVRKEAKQHGTRDVIEGLGADETLVGKRIMIADDVATSGKSILKAIQEVRSVGASVDLALVLVDREEGASEFLAEHGVTLISVFQAGDFL